MNNQKATPLSDDKPITAFVCSKPKCTDNGVLHKWNGPVVERGNISSVSCSKCGVLAYDVDTFMGGF